MSSAMAAPSAPGVLLKKLNLGARRALPFVSAHVRSQFSRGSFAVPHASIANRVRFHETFPRAPAGRVNET